MAPRVVIVAIGRNEGERLARCLDSVQALGLPAVYVDSGSTDGSPARARDRGLPVVELDPARPFSAGRARNEGLDEAMRRWPGAEVVQFVDGDCELVPGWLERGLAALDGDARVAAACGRVRELRREASVYNRLCDLEWEAPAGDALACGGNAMMRVAAFRAEGGFDPRLIGGEEPELCVRLRRRGWRILRVEGDMVRHDAAMTRFGQWWRRSLRGGWSYAEGAALHGRTEERHWVRETRSILFWGLALPVAILLAAGLAPPLALVLLAGYPVLGLRIYRRAIRGGTAPRDARPLAAFTVLGKFPQALGVVQYLVLHRMGRRRRVVDWRVSG